jgi:thioesterase-3
MLGPIHEYPFVIREHHLDTFGHVNNAAYLEILEEARWDLVTRNGYGLDEVHRLKVGPVVLEVRIRFVREIRNRQQVSIRTWLESYAGKIGTLKQEIRDETDELCTEARFTIGLG